MSTKTQLKFHDLPKDYEALCRFYLPRPIHDGMEYDEAGAVIETMGLWHEEFTAGQRDYFDLLATLVEEYDKAHVIIPGDGLSGIERLKLLLDEHEMDAGDLAAVLRTSETAAASILAEEIELTTGQLRRLSEQFAVSPAYFISDH